MSIWIIIALLTTIWSLASLPRDIRDENKLQITLDYENGVWKPTPLLIRNVHSYVNSYSDERSMRNRTILDRLFGSRQNWEIIIAEFTDYCSQLVPNDAAKSYSDQLVQK